MNAFANDSGTMTDNFVLVEVTVVVECKSSCEVDC